MRVTRRKNMFTKPTTESQLRTTEQHLPCAPPVQPQLRRASWLLLTAGESWAWERNSQSQSPLQTCPSTALTSAMAPKRAEASRALPSGTVLDSHSEPCSAFHPLSFRDLQFTSLGRCSSSEQGQNSQTRDWLGCKGTTAKPSCIGDPLSTVTPQLLCKFIQNFDQSFWHFMFPKERCCFFPRITALP